MKGVYIVMYLTRIKDLVGISSALEALKCKLTRNLKVTPVHLPFCERASLWLKFMF